MTENDDKTTPETEAQQTPEEAGAGLEAQIRATIGGWVGATPDDDWDTIGRLYEANFRGRIAGIFNTQPAEGREDVTWDDIGATIDRQLRKTVGGWAGASEEDDWSAVGNKIDVKIRDSMGKAVGAKPKASEPGAEAEGVEAEGAEAPEASNAASWEEIGGSVEQDIRRAIGGWVDADPDADWETIGDRFAERFRQLFGVVKDETTTPPPPESPKTQVPISDGDAEDEA